MKSLNYPFNSLLHCCKLNFHQGQQQKCKVLTKWIHILLQHVHCKMYFMTHKIQTHNLLYYQNLKQLNCTVFIKCVLNCANTSTFTKWQIFCKELFSESILKRNKHLASLLEHTLRSADWFIRVVLSRLDASRAGGGSHWSSSGLKKGKLISFPLLAEQGPEVSPHGGSWECQPHSHSGDPSSSSPSTSSYFFRLPL